MLKLQGVVVPEHETPELAPLQPAKKDPAVAVAARLPRSLFPVDVVHVAEHSRLLEESVVSVIWTCPEPVPAIDTVRFFAAAMYGPTKGPPSATGAAPAGSTSEVERSDIARARLRRPLPV